MSEEYFLNILLIIFYNPDDAAILKQARSIRILLMRRIYMDDKALLSKDKIAVDIAKLERNLNQVSDISFEGKEKEVYDRAVDYWNDSKYYLEKEDTRTAFGCIEYSHGLLDALRMIHGLI